MEFSETWQKKIAIIKTSPNNNMAGEMEELRRLVDQVDQNSRNIHLVLTGLAQEFQSVQGVVQFVRNQLKVNIQPCEIASVASIGMTKQGLTLTKVTFYSVGSRIKVYKARASMRGMANQIWLNEHLTKRREWLDFVARQLFKGKHIEKNWTFLGDIFIKKTANSIPEKICAEQDFGPLPQNLISQQNQPSTRGGDTSTQGLTSGSSLNTTAPIITVSPNYLSTNVEAGAQASNLLEDLPMVYLLTN